MERTNSSSLGRPSPVTSQPASVASATAYPPTAPPAPVTSSLRPAGSPSRSTRLGGGEGVQRDRGRGDGVEPGRDDGDRVGVEHDQVGLGPVVADHGVVEAGDDVAHGERGDLAADRDHAAGDVPAEAEPLAAVHGAAAGVGGDERVDRVHGGREGLDQDLAGAGAQVGDLDDLGLVVAGDGLDGAHRVPPWQ